MMIQKSLLFVILLVILSCSDDTIESLEVDNQTDDTTELEDDNTPEEEDESQTESFSFSIEVNGDYYNENFTGVLFLSDANGEILDEKSLENNSLNKIELDASSSLDITLMTKSTDQFNTETIINTFTNVSSGDYFLESSNKADGTFNLSLLNANRRMEGINYFAEGSSYFGSEDEGTFGYEIELEKFPNIFYGAFLSPDENAPRYLYIEETVKDSDLEFLFSDLPIIPNKVNIEHPPLNIFIESLDGFISTNSQREIISVHSNGTLGNDFYYPDGIFDNYRFSASFKCCLPAPRWYTMTWYGEPTDHSIEVPTYEVNLTSSDLSEFSFEKATSHNFNTVRFNNSFGNIYDDIYIFNIHNVGTSSLDISKKILLDNILQGEIESSELRFGSVIFKNNSFFENDYQQYIESVISKREEFPAGTEIFNVTFYPFSFN